MDALDQERLKVQEENHKKVLKLAHLYEEALEPRIVVLYRKLEEVIAFSQIPLTHVNIVLDMLKKSCIEMAHDAYVTRGKEILEKK
jgi:hypothetical protein